MATAAARALFDPLVEASYDPFEDDMGENSVQRFISEGLRPEVERLLRERGRETFVGADQYVGWHPDDRKKVVAPDVYVLPGVAPGEEFEFWKVWQTGIVPTFALEIVSTRKGKDYVDAPQRYADLGVEELIVFDPRYRRRRNGVQWQVHRPIARRGFVRVEATNDDRVRSRVLGCWLRAVGTGKHLRIRLAAEPRGDTIIPTAVEAERARADAAEAERKRAVTGQAEADARAESERERAESERRRAESERERAEVERAARERVEAELAELRAQLAGAKRKR